MAGEQSGQSEPTGYFEHGAEASGRRAELSLPVGNIQTFGLSAELQVAVAVSAMLLYLPTESFDNPDP